MRLLNDLGFQATVESERPEDVGRRYCRRRGRGQNAIRDLAQMCLDARRHHACKSFVIIAAQVSEWGAWSDEPVERQSRFRLGEVARGAELVARYGAGQCVDCGALLARDRAGEMWCEAHTPAPEIRACCRREVRRAMARALEALGRVVWA